MMRFSRSGPPLRPETAAAIALVCALSAHPAAADGPFAAGPGGAAPLTADEFRAFAEGWTLYFELEGAPFGTERFSHGGRTVWRPAGGICTPGLWTAVGPEVCFFYGGESACWLLWRDAGGLVARSSPDGDMEVRVSRRDRAPLDCGEELLSRLDPAPSAS